MIWSAIITAIAGIIGLIVSHGENSMTNAQNAELARENREDAQAYNTQAANIANQRTINNYNQLYSPTAQVNQLKSAGLNPALIYGKGGSGGTGQAAAMAAPANMPAPIMQPTVNNNWMTDIISSLQETIKTDTERDTKKSEKDLNYSKVDEINAKIKETEANTKKIEEETKTQVITQNYQILQNKLAELDIKYQNETFEKRVKTIEEEYALIKENVRKTGKEIDVMDVEYKWKPKLYENTIKLNNAQIELLGQQKLVAIAQEALTYLQTASEEARQTLMKEQSNETAERAYQINVTTKQLEEQLKEIQNFGYSATNSDTWIGVLLGTLKKASTLIGDKIQY